MGRGKRHELGSLSLSDTRTRLAPAGDLSWPKLATRIPASARLESQERGVRFDALYWFERASDEELVALAEGFFGYSKEATAVAKTVLEDPNVRYAAPLLVDLFEGQETTPAAEREALEVEIDVDTARQWLAENRPHLLPWLDGDCVFATPHYQVHQWTERDEEGLELGKVWEIRRPNALESEAVLKEERGAGLAEAKAKAEELELLMEP